MRYQAQALKWQYLHFTTCCLLCCHVLYLKKKFSFVFLLFDADFLTTFIIPPGHRLTTEETIPPTLLKRILLIAKKTDLALLTDFD